MDLILRGVSKAYGRQVALCGIDLSLSTADNGVIALLGPNGSGKSTLLRLLATLVQPDRGWMSFGKYSYQGDLTGLRDNIGYLPQDLDLPESLTPSRLLRYLAHMRQIDPDHIPALLDRLNLTRLVDKPLGSLSSGQVRLVGLAQAMLGDKSLLLLDEMLRGLDVQQQERVLSLIRKSAPGRLILFSTHIPAEVERVASTVIVLNEGRIIYAGSVDRLRDMACGSVHEVEVATTEIPTALAQAIVSRVMQSGLRTTLRVVGDLPSGWRGRAVSPTLEDAYILRGRRLTT